MLAAHDRCEKILKLLKLQRKRSSAELSSSEWANNSFLHYHLLLPENKGMMFKMSLTSSIFVSYPWKLPSAALGRPSYQKR